MKWFTCPDGKFIIEIPIEWQYSNRIAGNTDEPPFSFQDYFDPIGAFQLSCYPSEEKIRCNNIEKQEIGKSNLVFIRKRMDGGGFNVHLYYCFVDNHFFMAKYIYDTVKENHLAVKKELDKVETALSSLKLLNLDDRDEAIIIDKYEKFMAALAASFDIKNNAIKNESYFEFIIITANQIDAYLRLAIVMKLQLINQSDDICIEYLSQEGTDKFFMERKIYQISKDLNIISEEIHTELSDLYDLRNKIVHRYIITNYNTVDTFKIAWKYELACEKIRLIIKDIEDSQADKKIGIYKNGCPEISDFDNEALSFIFSQVNDKHLDKDMYRSIS